MRKSASSSSNCVKLSRELRFGAEVFEYPPLPAGSGQLRARGEVFFEGSHQSDAI